jgi:hypothetical protein
MEASPDIKSSLPGRTWRGELISQYYMENCEKAHAPGTSTAAQLGFQNRKILVSTNLLLFYTSLYMP